MNPQRVLLIGDAERQVQAALAQAAPDAQITAVASWFDGIAELTGGRFSTVLASVELIERRPEAAVRTLRDVSAGARLLLFGHPTLEGLSRKMQAVGCDDYLLTPASATELQQTLSTPLLRIAPAAPAEEQPPESSRLLQALPLADICLDAMLQDPHDSTSRAVQQINERLEPGMQVQLTPPGAAAPGVMEGLSVVSSGVRSGTEDVGTLHLSFPREQPQAAARHLVAQLGQLVGKVATLQERHNRLQKLAITDDLTGTYNARYFHHFLERILERAKEKLFLVTLLLFDIDNFKRYNDQYGHAVGDQILKQTAALMRRCCRDHDLVARIGGDEFAVVFWEKEGPRQPRDPKSAGPHARTPQTPVQILERFRRLIRTERFEGLGPTGQGVLTISGGLAVYPHHGQTAEQLRLAADRALVFTAKQAGKNSIRLVGGGDVGEEPAPPDEPPPTA